MLRSLHIENIAVIKNADITFGDGFSVLTGETGAGKSIIIDSINILTGSRIQRELIRSGEEKALVSAVFDELTDNVIDAISEMGIDCPDRCVMLQRTLSSDGKSTARINGRSVTQTMLRDAGALLISIHGQSDTRILMNRESHISMLDKYADDTALLEAYRTTYSELCEVRTKLASIRQNEAEKIRTREMLEYQINDIESVNPRAGEEELLEKEAARISNIEKISKQTAFTQRILAGSDKGSAVYLLGRAAASMRQISSVIPEAGEIADRLTDYGYEISDIAETVAVFSGEPEGNPTVVLDKIQSRLDAFAKLRRKYGSTVEEVIEFKNNAKKRLDELESSDAIVEKLSTRAKSLKAEAVKKADAISAVRHTAAVEAGEKIRETLSYLDMPKVNFSVSVTPSELNRNGCDSVEFLISTNPGEPLKPMISIASGGELSRIMLALRSVLNDRDGPGCAIFDEIDTGISGGTSRRVGIKMRRSAAGSQVICVTHSAQIASLADTHYFISKEEIDGRAQTCVRVLNHDERRDEIARILGGIDITDAQKQAAEDMITGRDVDDG